MIYRIIFFILSISIISCTEKSEKINYSKIFTSYTNKGFALVYEEKLFKEKIINKRLDDRSLLIFNNSIEKETPVRITNLLNGKYLIAKVGKNANYPFFYNSVISRRIAADLKIDINEPYVEIKTLNQINSFIINKAKTFDEEKKVADKVPVQGIEIENISINSDKTKNVKIKPESKTPFNYIIRIADLYFEDSANILKERLENEYNISNVKVKKMSKNSYRVYKGPFYNLDSIKRVYSEVIKLNFENIEIIKI
tara:strand:+ start:334 stop:1095 length:762 start_codon:yes stop_codon:yes gene_type:complete